MKYILGVDISAASIKATELNSSGQAYGGKTEKSTSIVPPDQIVKLGAASYIESFSLFNGSAINNSCADMNDRVFLEMLTQDEMPLRPAILSTDKYETEEGEEIEKQLNKANIPRCKNSCGKCSWRLGSATESSDKPCKKG